VRQLIAEEAPRDGALTLSPERIKYLRRVLRFSEGELVPVRLPGNELRRMTLARGAGGEWFLRERPGERGDSPAGDNLFDRVEFALLQFLPKFTRMDVIVRQMTECGVRFILPVRGEFSPPGDPASRALRWRNIIREAREQSASPVRTELLDPLAPEDALAWVVSRGRELGGRTLPVMLHEIRGQSSLSGLAAGGGVRLAVIAVGSEGGMSDREQGACLDAGFTGVHFRTNILRVDTAALYGMAALQSALAIGDIDGETTTEHSQRAR
jgi:16S rRNA (uracil1498-N3)-methyltransferase